MANVIDVRDLGNEDVEIVERLVERLKDKAGKKRGTVKHKESGLEGSAGSWRGLIDAEELISGIYADRLISTRSEAKL